MFSVVRQLVYGSEPATDQAMGVDPDSDAGLHSCAAVINRTGFASYWQTVSLLGCGKLQRTNCCRRDVMPVIVAR